MAVGERRPGLDLLRVVAVAAVAWFHFGFRMQVTGEAGPADFGAPGGFARYGYLGVSVFFAISGYVISISTEGRGAYGFAVARFARLWPGFAVCMSLTALVTLLVPGLGFSVSAAQYLANLTMVAPFLGQPFMDGAYWSIVVEILFYGWVALLMACGLWQRWPVAIAIVWLVIAALDQAVIGSGLLRRLFLTDFTGFFVFGMMLRAAERQVLGARVVLVAALVQAISGGVLFAARLPAVYGGEPFDALTVAGLVLGALLLFFGLSRLRLPDGATAAAGVAGRMTYPLYLLHQHIGYAAFFLLGPALGGAGSALVLAVALGGAALVITGWIEPPAARAVRRGGMWLGEWAQARAAPLLVARRRR